jgi:hypothetical protein
MRWMSRIVANGYQVDRYVLRHNPDSASALSRSLRGRGRSIAIRIHVPTASYSRTEDSGTVEAKGNASRD